MTNTNHVYVRTYTAAAVAHADTQHYLVPRVERRLSAYKVQYNIDLYNSSIIYLEVLRN